MLKVVGSIPAEAAQIMSCKSGLVGTANEGGDNQSKWTKGSILTKIIRTYKSEMPGNSAVIYVTLHEFHSLLICNGVK